MAHLTNECVVADVCVGGLGHYWFRYRLVACSVACHNSHHWWYHINSTLRNIFQWNVNQNFNRFVQENAFEYIVCKKISHVILVSICYQMCSYSITRLGGAQRSAVLLSCIFDSQISPFSLIDESMTRELKIMCVKNIFIYTHISYGEGEEQRCIWINGITT